MNRLYDYLEKNNISLIEDNIPFKGLKGLCHKDTIIIDSRIETSAERACILAEEIGHYKTTYGNILDQSDIRNVKQEVIARRWAYFEVVTLAKIIQAYESGCKNRYELAEYINVTEDFLDEALTHYKAVHGQYIRDDSYVVYLEPLGVMKVNV